MDMEDNMVKKLCAYIFFLVFFFSGCNHAGGKPPAFNEIVSFAKDHAETLISCSCFLLDNYAAKDDAINISENQDGTMRLYSYHLESVEEEKIPELEPLFATNMIEVITVRDDAIEYSVGGSGIGSNMTYYKVIFVPSDDIEDLFGYSDKFVYHPDEATGGILGEKNGSDDTFFYYKIQNCLYYVIAHF